jgi:hypothetical protein
MSLRRIFAAAVAALALVTLTVGCGSSDEPEAEGPFAGSITTAKGGPKSSTTTQTTVAVDVDLSGDFCEKARQLQTVGDDLFAGGTADASPEALLASLEQLFKTLDEILGQLSEDPPAEIADDIALIAEDVSSKYEEIQGMSSVEDAAELAQKGLGGNDQPEELEKATANIEAYAEKECGITG